MADDRADEGVDSPDSNLPEDWERPESGDLLEFKPGPPAYQRDRFFYRVVAFTLSIVAIVSLVASTYLAKERQQVPDSIVALGSTAVGALAGVPVAGRT